MPTPPRAPQDGDPALLRSTPGPLQRLMREGEGER